MVKSILRIAAVILNFGIIAFILGLAVRGSLEFDNLNSWVFIAVAMATPLVNISGLLGKPEAMKPWAALIVNTLVLLIFSMIILLVMIWPMGSKPRGAELVYIFSVYSAFLFTEVSLLSLLKN